VRPSFAGGAQLVSIAYLNPKRRDSKCIKEFSAKTQKYFSSMTRIKTFFLKVTFIRNTAKAI